MAIEKIDHTKCEVCKVRMEQGCPLARSCFQDVIRLDEGGKPYIAYPDDCNGCYRYYYACQVDCPYGAVEVSPLFPLGVLSF